MNHRLCLALLLWVAVVYAARADESSASSAQCPLALLADPIRYERLHQIPTKAAPDDPTHKIVTPGGMILETPRMVAATDTLTIIARDSSALCFELITFSRNRSRCHMSGVARAEELGTFQEHELSLRMVLLTPEQIRVEPLADAYRKHCEKSGRVDSAIYTAIRTPGTSLAK
jgi:hypothetical protein